MNSAKLISVFIIGMAITIAGIFGIQQLGLPKMAESGVAAMFVTGISVVIHFADQHFRRLTDEEKESPQ